jgi:hypothetical protein
MQRTALGGADTRRRYLMTTRRLILGTTTLAMASGIAAFAAQHTQHQAAPDHLAMVAGLHASCAATGSTTAATPHPHVPAHLAQALDLTPAQTAEVDRITAELCQVMNRTHDAIHNLLTPEQRARLAKMHGDDHGATGLHALMKKLHGGK